MEEESSLPPEILSLIKNLSFSQIQDIFHVRTHFNQDKVQYYIRGNLRYYDDTDYTRMKTNFVIMEYTKDEQLKLMSFLKRHFRTSAKIPIKAKQGDFRLSRLCVKKNIPKSHPT